ncbi:MAG: hypothetical protein Q9220_007591 [cf. Caloplaca sp. 1 TL-2023]
MVSFWPWKVDDNSPASFERALSTLSDQITKCNAKLDSLRQRSRRYSALWTLYTSFAYLLCAVVLVLIVGWRNWGLVEYIGVVGGPVIIYTVRAAITAIYGVRIAKIQAQSDGLQKQREATIEKLKAATKYNTTQELLKKYGGTPPSREKSSRGNLEDIKAEERSSPASVQRRTNFAPPPTANIPGRSGAVSQPGTPQRGIPHLQDHQGQDRPSTAAAAIPPWREPPPEEDHSADFAPNAFSSAPEYARQGEGTRWYDRIMDVILGEDETLPRNRLALICQRCRLVNGQAPPGVQRLEDVGDWRCPGCGTMNGEEKEEAKLLKEIQTHTETLAPPTELTDDEKTETKSNGRKESDAQSFKDERSSDSSEDAESSKDEKERPRTRGQASGAQKETRQARRRSTRVKKEAKA